MDARLPIVCGAEPRPQDAVLLEAGLDAPVAGYVARFEPAAHGIGCACCGGRPAVAVTLAALFRARATGAAPFFNRVVALVSVAGEAAIREALAEDAVTAARYKTG